MFIVYKFLKKWILQLRASNFRGPDNLDVYADSSSSRSRANVNLERQQITLQKQIRALLMNVRSIPWRFINIEQTQMPYLCR